MRKKLSVLFLMVSILVLIPTSSVSAKKPLIGAMDLQFDRNWFSHPTPEHPDWVGTITIDKVTYGMAFFVYGSGKPFSEDPNLKVHFFKEKYVIYYELDFAFDDEGNLIKFVEGEWEVFENSPILRAMASTYFVEITKEEARRIFYGDWTNMPVFYMDYEGHEGEIEDGEAFDRDWDIFCVESQYGTEIEKLREEQVTCGK